MSQTSLFQVQEKSSDFAELCNALYEREVSTLANQKDVPVAILQGRLKSLPYYIQQTAHRMIAIESPLTLDVQNATWSAKQSKNKPYTSQKEDEIWAWFEKSVVVPGLVVPINVSGHIVLDSVDRIDEQNHRFRTNVFGWFNVENHQNEYRKLLKPTKKIMMSACAGHCWRENGPIDPIIPSLRELLLSCSINWRNFKRPSPVSV